MRLFLILIFHITLKHILCIMTSKLETFAFCSMPEPHRDNEDLSAKGKQLFYNFTGTKDKIHNIVIPPPLLLRRRDIFALHMMVGMLVSLLVCLSSLSCATIISRTLCVRSLRLKVDIH